MRCSDPNRFSRPAPCPEERREECRFPAAYLLQRILAQGQTHRRCQTYPVSFCDLPVQAVPPFTVTDACLWGEPAWQEEGCPHRRGMTLRVTLPLALRVRDGNGQMYMIPAKIEDSVTLCYDEPPRDCWRGQISVQAAVRLSSRCYPCDDRQCALPLEVVISAYLLCPCAARRPGGDGCFDPRPLYPQPICFDR